jgi:RNA polymerase sigma-70 factor (ECF subfamily)
MSFAQAAESHLDDVFGYLAWFTGDRFVAEDLTGETFERALRLWHRFDAKRGSERTWLCQIARTVALDHFRSERRRTRREELAAVPERIDERVAEGLSPELERGMLRLSAGEREVIALRVVLDLDAGTAAGVLGISPTNCTTRLNRALKKLEEAVHVAA